MIKKIKSAAAPSPPAAPAPLTLPHFGSLWRLFIYTLAVIAPGAGLATGVLYGRQDDKDARNFGRICLVLSLIGLILRAMRGVQGGDTLNQPLY